MGASAHVMYYNAITQIEAQEALILMAIAEYPHITKKDERKKRHKAYHRLAYPETHKTKRPLNLEMMTGFLNSNSKKVSHG